MSSVEALGLPGSNGEFGSGQHNTQLTREVLLRLNHANGQPVSVKLKSQTQEPVASDGIMLQLRLTTGLHTSSNGQSALHEISIFVPKSDANQLLSPWLNNLPLAELPPPFLEAAIELFFQDFKVSGMSDYGTNVEVVSASFRTNFSDNFAANSATLSAGQMNENRWIAIELAGLPHQIASQQVSQTLRAYWPAPKAVWMPLLNNHGQRQVRNLQLTLPVTFCIGYTLIAQTDVANLEPGDIVLLENNLYQRGQCWVLINQQATWQAQLADTRITVTQPHDSPFTLTSPWKQTMTDQQHSPDEHAPHSAKSQEQTTPDTANQTDNSALKDVPMMVSFALPHQHMSLQDIQTVQQGYVFALPEEAENDIAVIVNGTVLGKGSLINVAGRLGVLLNSWGESSLPVQSMQAHSLATLETLESGKEYTSNSPANLEPSPPLQESTPPVDEHLASSMPETHSQHQSDNSTESLQGQQHGN